MHCDATPGFPGCHLLAALWVQLSVALLSAASRWLLEAKSWFLATLPYPAMPLGSAVEILATDDPDFAQEEEQELQVYEKHDDLLHGPSRRK